MKTFLSITLFLLTALAAMAQTTYNYKQGYRFIRNAENSLNTKQLKQAEVFIKKAKNSNYGFCGNAWAEAHGRIDILESKILMKQKKYDQALMVLDSIDGC